MLREKQRKIINEIRLTGIIKLYSTFVHLNIYKNYILYSSTPTNIESNGKRKLT